LSLAAEGTDVSPYHLEAAIAAVHARAASVEDTDWSEIIWLYDMLMALRPGPIVALNRAIAVAQEERPERGLEEIRSIDRPDRFTNYPFFPEPIDHARSSRTRYDVSWNLMTAWSRARSRRARVTSLFRRHHDLVRRHHDLVLTLGGDFKARLTISAPPNGAPTSAGRFMATKSRPDQPGASRRHCSRTRSRNVTCPWLRGVVAPGMLVQHFQIPKRVRRMELRLCRFKYPYNVKESWYWNPRVTGDGRKGSKS
jgi:hypothetical protein